MNLYNTLTKKVEEFKPLKDKEAKLYTCGLTVYSHPHIGNWVSYIYWDVLVRVLRANGYDVNRVQNITDVGHLTSDEDAGEDKMLKGALKEGKTAWEVAEKYIQIADDEAYTKLCLIKPDHMPRATDFIEQQIKFVEELEAKGFTYTLEDGVYFDTSKLDDYGKLAKLDIEGLRFGARVEDTGKKNPTDFALWKFSRTDEKRDMQWDSPWGAGFPGWHLECSVMARELLGDQIDIHTGGIDHIPVHHTNEIAQTEALTQKQFSQIWMHANHIKVDGTKMSKSLGNIYTLADIEDKGFDIQAFKLMILAKHYRTEGNFTWANLEAAQNRLNNWQKMADLKWQLEESEHDINILAILYEDIDTQKATTAIDSYFDSCSKEQNAPSKKSLLDIRNMLGIDLFKSDITDEQKDIIAKRQKARETGNWTLSDEYREKLSQQGIAVKDTDSRCIWSRL